jgi:hypothetical protein
MIDTDVTNSISKSTCIKKYSQKIWKSHFSPHELSSDPLEQFPVKVLIPMASITKYPRKRIDEKAHSVATPVMEARLGIRPLESTDWLKDNAESFSVKSFEPGLYGTFNYWSLFRRIQTGFGVDFVRETSPMIETSGDALRGLPSCAGGNSHSLVIFR